MRDMIIRSLLPDEWNAVAELIHVSTNYWYQANGKPAIFSGGPETTRLFCDVYETLDPGCCVVAEVAETGRLAGSCFYHPRPSHVSLGIMNVHPSYFNQGVARQLLQFILNIAENEKKPVRLVSSAMNLDSYSLYTRAGFVPRTLFQDMYLSVPADGLPFASPSRQGSVRTATLADVDAMAALEWELHHIRRDKDYRYFMGSRDGIWHVSVLENGQGEIDGFLVSITHPGSNMLGPGVMRTEEQAMALIYAELNHHKGRTPVWLVPAADGVLVRQMYAWGAKNCELHVAQVRGEWTASKGILMPTFMPETG